MQKYFLIVLLFLSSCSFNNVTKLHIENKNDHSITITVIANNIKHVVKNIAPNSTAEETMDWTNIEKKDGEWQFIVYHENTQGSDSYNHGVIHNGELNSFVNLTSTGNQLKVEITE